VGNDESECASWNSAAEPATCDGDLSTTLVGTDHAQDCHVRVKKKKKHEHRSHIGSHSMEDGLSSDVSLRQESERNVTKCREKPTTDHQLSLSPNIETDHQVATASNQADNTEHLTQPEVLLDNVALVSDSSMTASSSPVTSQVNKSYLATDEQQIVKLSHSAKRRRRRHRVRKSGLTNIEGDVLNDEQRKNIVTATSSSSQNVSNSILPTQTGSLLVAGLGRTHIVFDNANRDDDSDNIKASVTTYLTCDNQDKQTLKDQDQDRSTVVSGGVINFTPQVETVPHLPHGNSVSTAVVCSDVDKVSSADCTLVATKARYPVKKPQFANAPVFCRQRNKKSASATHIPNAEAADALTAALSEQASSISSQYFVGYKYIFTVSTKMCVCVR